MSELLKTVIIKGTSAPNVLRLDEVKDHLRLEKGYTEEDDVLKGLRSAALERVESITNRKFGRQQWACYYDSWSSGDSIVLPYSPLIQVSSSTGVTNNSSGRGIAYLTSSSGWNAFSSGSTGWYTDKVSIPPRVVLSYNAEWPSETLHNLNPIVIHGTFGHTTTPESAKLAMKMMIGHWYENREEYLVGYGGVSAVRIPSAVDSLLASLRVWYF
jgi:hypothetical protein